MPTPPPYVNSNPHIRERLGLWDATSVIIGIVVGSAIFKAPPMIFGSVTGPWHGLGLWAFGGALSLAGGLCYAELGSAYRPVGGDYVFITRAYGRLAGFLFGWSHLGGVLTGSIGALAFVFADHAIGLWQLGSQYTALIAALAIALLTVVNLFGVNVGKNLQNTLTVVKAVGLAMVTGAGLLRGSAPLTVTPRPESGTRYGLALILVLYAYGGWSDSAFVAAEVRDGKRNIPRALILGTLSVTVIYLLVNSAYLRALGFEDIQLSQTPAADTLGLVVGRGAAGLMYVLVMLSALGGLNGVVLTGSRVHVALGADHQLFAWLGRWHPRLQAPNRSLVVQALVSIGLVTAVGSQAGRQCIDSLLGYLGLGPTPWQHYGGGFETLVSATAPVFWLFFLLSGLSLFVLRFTDRATPRPFKVPLYPFVPLAFCCTSAGMLWASVQHARHLLLPVVALVCLGFPLYALSNRLRARDG